MLRFIACCLVASCCAFACGGDDEGSSSGGQGGGDDGKVHPPGNGVHISEAEACEMLQTAFQDRKFDLQCASQVVRACPGFVRINYDPDCVEFDQGSVQGCIDYWNDKHVCELLVEDECLADTFAGTTSAGCTPGQ